LTYPCIRTFCRLSKRSWEARRSSRNEVDVDGNGCVRGGSGGGGFDLGGRFCVRTGASARRRIRGNWLIGIRGCAGRTGRIVRDGTRSNEGVDRLTLNSVELRDGTGMPLAAIRRAASLDWFEIKYMNIRFDRRTNLGVIIERFVDEAATCVASSSLKKKKTQVRYANILVEIYEQSDRFTIVNR